MSYKKKFPDAAVIDWPIRIITRVKGGSEMHLATPQNLSLIFLKLR